MFDSLRKKLKEAVEKVSKTIKEEPKPPKEEIKEQEEDRKILEEFDKRIEEQELEERLEKEVEEAKEEKELKTRLEPLMHEPEEERPQESIFETRKEKEIKEEELPSELKEGKEIKGEELPSVLVKEEKKKPGFFARLFEKELTEQDVQIVLKELQLALLENDVALEVAERISNDIKKELVGKMVRKGKIEDIIKHALRNAMLDVMQQEKIDLDQMINNKAGPFIIIFLGFNGTGKTTTIAKLAHKYKRYSPIIAAADTFRAASIEQLETHAQRLGVRVVKHNYGSDSAAVIFDAKKAALAGNTKLVLADTAGRSHANVNLMDELKKIVRVNSPDLKILVLDSLTGNDIFEQSRLFNGAVGVDAIILTKADVYDKGGAALSAAYTIKKPILYLGVGQEYEDLKEFNPEEIVENLLG